MQNKRNTYTRIWTRNAVHTMLRWSSHRISSALSSSHFISSREWECEWAAKTEEMSNHFAHPAAETKTATPPPNSTSIPLSSTKPLLSLPLLRLFAAPWGGSSNNSRRYAAEQWNPQRVGQKAWVKLWAKAKSQSQLYNLTLRFAAIPL